MVVIKAGMNYCCLPQPGCIVVAQKLLIGRRRQSNKELQNSSVYTALLVRWALVTAPL